MSEISKHAKKAARTIAHLVYLDLAEMGPFEEKAAAIIQEAAIAAGGSDMKKRKRAVAWMVEWEERDDDRAKWHKNRSSDPASERAAMELIDYLAGDPDVRNVSQPTPLVRRE